jgi:hypothetical protein
MVCRLLDYGWTAPEPVAFSRALLSQNDLINSASLSIVI